MTTDDTARPRQRLSAAKRRELLVEAATQRFSSTSYHATTMAEIAEAAGVSAAIVYRHFTSKAELFAACLGREWNLLRERWVDALTSTPVPRDRMMALATTYLGGGEPSRRLASMWFQAIAESPNEPLLRAAFEQTLAATHAFVRDVVDGSRGPSGLDPERVPEVEAWVFLGIGMLAAADMRTGGAMLADLPELHRQRMQWLVGRA